MSGITTHVLDAVQGGGAVGIAVRLRVQAADGFRDLARATTDANGRAVLLADAEVGVATYELAFETLQFHRAQGHAPFFDEVVIRFVVGEAGGSWHVPIVLSPAAYTTYRGGVPPANAAALPPELVR